jgi:glucosamine--fructose-6-phosphate aminotransferase (isomerizing)
MCGIVGYVGGRRDVIPLLLEGLARLEYRGYDSAGLAVLDAGEIRVVKTAGKVRDLQARIAADWPEHAASGSQVGIAHTRWATHGAPNEVNAHPHMDLDDRRFAVVHNGIIENYTALKTQLQRNGHVFVSETDTEVLVHLISQCYEGDLCQAVAAALQQVEGTFGIAVLCAEAPDTLVVARRGSPIVIGIGQDETLVASDVTPLVAHTRKVIYLDDDDIALIRPGQVEVRNISNVPVSREIAHIDWDIGAAEKGGFEHFMLKEIYEQPEAVANAVRGRIDHQLGSAILSGLRFEPADLVGVNRIVIAACGTSLHAGMMGEYFFEDLADLPTEVEQAAEFRYRNPIIAPGTLVLAISQSGETADTLAAVREAKQKGAVVAGLCNVVGSTIARECGRGVYLHAGPEIGVASTKAFTAQVAVLLMMAMKFARSRRLSRPAGLLLGQEIEALPDLVRTVLERADAIAAVARKYAAAEHFFYIGRGYLYPVALEGALKLKEISYIHAEGYHAAELKHGPIALLEKSVPVLALANDLPGKDKIIGNIQECRARQSPVIAVGTDGDPDLDGHADDILWVPACSPAITPIPTVVALQLFAYFVARERGCAIDQPRNLAKSVTVE